jgi:hypothetical protein
MIYAMPRIGGEGSIMWLALGIAILAAGIVATAIEKTKELLGGEE